MEGDDMECKVHEENGREQVGVCATCLWERLCMLVAAGGTNPCDWSISSSSEEEEEEEEEAGQGERANLPFPVIMPGRFSNASGFDRHVPFCRDLPARHSDATEIPLMTRVAPPLIIPPRKSSWWALPLLLRRPNNKDAKVPVNLKEEENSDDDDDDISSIGIKATGKVSDVPPHCLAVLTNSEDRSRRSRGRRRSRGTSGKWISSLLPGVASSGWPNHRLNNSYLPSNDLYCKTPPQTYTVELSQQSKEHDPAPFNRFRFGFLRSHVALWRSSSARQHGSGRDDNESVSSAPNYLSSTQSHSSISSSIRGGDGHCRAFGFRLGPLLRRTQSTRKSDESKIELPSPLTPVPKPASTSAWSFFHSHKDARERQTTN